MKIRYIAAIGLIAGASAAQAQVVFSDNFDTDQLALNKTTFAGGWTVGMGSVDVIGTGTAAQGAGAGQPGNATSYNFGFSQGAFIDLDGSSADSGAFSKSLNLTAGTTYTASFQLAGSQRNFTESVNVTFGMASATYMYAKGATFTTSMLSFTPTTTGSYSLTFNEPGPSNLEGLLLDNVSVVAVPEPSTYGLMFAGLAAIGYVARRRKAV